MDDRDEFGRLATGMFERFAGRLDRTVIASETMRVWLSVRGRYASPFGSEVADHITGHLARLAGPADTGSATPPRQRRQPRRREGREISLSTARPPRR